MFSRNRSSVPHDPERFDFWISYSDLMAGLLGVFALLLIATLNSFSEEVKDVRHVLEQRKEIARQLYERFRNDPEVEVNPDTGAIRFHGDVLFEHGSDELMPHGEEILDRVMPVYLQTILGEPAFREYLDKIMITGHADSTHASLYGNGGQDYDRAAAYQYNLDLSQARASSVMRHLLGSADVEPYRSDLKKYAVASGRSFMDPVRDETGVVDMQRSRRIEIYFRLKDEQALEEVMQILFADG